ncbi:MAG: hypothetical protein AMS23_06205 [Bacteroides sp. SM1_62]|nr:MAG: hypothetical protein AMS26_06980 [Bacteroides sp. SM23_62]KPL23779.1 MAG: hypothetical protein AMS23_06205 [Bacteroides sp. SM1_62]
MIELDDKVVSFDIIREKFVCDLAKCKGNCCVEGESGAPLEDDEVKMLKAEYEKIRPYLREEGRKAIAIQGTSIRDTDQEMVTPLVGGHNECAYVLFENGIARCGIEKAWEAGATGFRKPVSCHIYPIRIKNYSSMKAVNYDRWKVCDPAREHGERENVPVYRFVKDAIERKFGADFYRKLQIISDGMGEDMTED